MRSIVEQMITILADAASMTLPLGLPSKVEVISHHRLGVPVVGSPDHQRVGLMREDIPRRHPHLRQQLWRTQ
eukprot:6476523-Amphidinium_carterae.1